MNIPSAIISNKRIHIITKIFIVDLHCDLDICHAVGPLAFLIYQALCQCYSVSQ